VEINQLVFWVYVTAITFLLPIGTFSLIIGIYMRLTGNFVEPMFKNPLAARTIAEFWSRRWNLMFSRSSFRTVFKPLIRKGYSPIVATMAVFIASAIAHELLLFVISGAFDGYNGSFFL